MNKKKIKEIASNYIGIYAVASSISHKTIMMGLPIPAKYPPSYVLVPKTKKIKSQLSTPLRTTTKRIIEARKGIKQERNTMQIPSGTIMRGNVYYEKLKKSRGL